MLLRTLAFVLLLATPAVAQSRAAPEWAPSSPIGFATALELEGSELFVGRTGAIQGFPLNPSHPGGLSRRVQCS